MNNNCQRLHETVVKDIVDILSDVKDFDQVEWIRNKNNVGSIAKRASNLILVFPVICSTSVSINTAGIISKAIERKCVELLRILFSSIQLTEYDNMYDYIRQFHTNLNNGLSIDDFMDAMDKLSESGQITITDHDAYETVREGMRHINYVLPNELNALSINDYSVKDVRNVYGESTIICEANKPDPNNMSKTDKMLNLMRSMRRDNDNMMDKINSLDKQQKQLNIISKAAKANADTNASTASKSFSQPSFKDTTTYYTNQITSKDIQKVNELVPTTMMVNFVTKDDSSNKFVTTGIIGVKAKLYAVDGMEIVNRIASKYADSNTLFNLVRAATREISFFKDLLFAVDKAKIDAVNMSRESNNARMFKLLERRAAKNHFSALLKKNDASPITSLLISQEEVEYLKKYHNIDMEKNYVTRSVLEKYNLMDIVIADESLEVAKFLFDDGEGVYEVLPFDELEKQSKDGAYKKVVNLMSKISR